jgi:hypothetical protein
LDPIGVGILQLPFSLAIVILVPLVGTIAIKYGNTKLLVPAAIILVVGFASV